MRRRAADAQLVIVANHHLFFADLALRARWPEAQVLPPYEVVIFDEAHQIEDVATEFFGLHVSTQRLFALARDLGREPAPTSCAARARGAPALQAATDALAEALRDRLPRAARRAATRCACPFADGPVRRGRGRWRRYHELDTVLEEIADWLRRRDGRARCAASPPARRARRARRRRAGGAARRSGAC